MQWLLIIVLVIIAYSENSQVNGEKYEEKEHLLHRIKGKQMKIIEKTDKVQKRKKVRGFKRRRTLIRKRKPKKKGKQPKKQRGSNVGQRKMKRNQKRTQKWIYDPKKQKINTKTKIKHKTHKIMKYLVERKKNKNQESYKSRKLSRSVLTGDNCNWLDFDTARSRGAGCADGTKMVIKNKKGVRKQFLLTNGKTIYGFATKGEKFASCANLADVTDSVACKEVTGLSTLSLSGSTRAAQTGGRTPFVGKTCDWIDINKVKSGGENCEDGTKFVVKQEKGTRKQFLFVDGKDIIAFVKNKEKFVNCSIFTEVTEMIQCKKVDGVEGLSLDGTSSPSPAPSPPSPPGE